MTEEQGLVFGSEDVSISRIVLVQPVSTNLKERGFTDKDFALVPDDVRLMIDGEPGFRFVPVFWVKDRWWNVAGAGDIICQGTQLDSRWTGRIVKGEKPNDMNLDCWTCPNAADVGHMNRPGPNYHGEWVRACTFRHNYPIRITAGLPEGVDAPPITILSLGKMPGKDAARFVNTTARRDRGLIYRSEFVARAEPAKSKRPYFRFQITRAGPTPDDLLREFEPMYLEMRAEPTLITGPTAASEVKYYQDASTESDLPM